MRVRSHNGKSNKLPLQGSLKVRELSTLHPAYVQYAMSAPCSVHQSRNLQGCGSVCSGYLSRLSCTPGPIWQSTLGLNGRCTGSCMGWPQYRSW